MSEGKGVTKTYVAAATALDATGDKLTVEIVKPVVVQRAGVVADGGTDIDTGFVMAVDHRPTAGTDADVSSRGARAELFTLTPSAAQSQGNGVYHDAESRHEAKPGEELVLEVTSAAQAGATGHMFLEVIEYPFAGVDKLEHMTDET